MVAEAEYQDVLYKELMDTIENGENPTKMRWMLERYIAYEFMEDGDVFRVTHTTTTPDSIESEHRDFKSFPVALAHAMMI